MARSRSVRSSGCLLPLTVIAATVSFGPLSFVPAPHEKASPSLATRRDAAAAALLTALSAPGVAQAGISSWNYEADKKSLDGYNFDGLTSKLGRNLDKGYDKVKLDCQEIDVLVQGGSGKFDGEAKKYICDRTDRKLAKGQELNGDIKTKK
eukprot:TRINITY_DN5101_c0_g1_i1.p1 TRINITY_DN5101_c0_g1~~TRINITY_DN5101_c0_g1_i1.p1  ORF type:complete len:151 (-),score=30.02 TRINITY_DN5101_c0_g1_i1:181-633(-)